MEQSILTSIKKLLGLDEDYTQFDEDIIIHINSAFFNLMQLGVGPPIGFSIKSKVDEWDSYLLDHKDLDAVKTYIYLRVRLLFDPPQMGYLVDAIKSQISEMEWRLNVQIETPGYEFTSIGDGAYGV